MVVDDFIPTNTDRYSRYLKMSLPMSCIHHALKALPNTFYTIRLNQTLLISRWNEIRINNEINACILLYFARSLWGQSIQSAAWTFNARSMVIILYCSDYKQAYYISEFKNLQIRSNWLKGWKRNSWPKREASIFQIYVLKFDYTME